MTAFVNKSRDPNRIIASPMKKKTTEERNNKRKKKTEAGIHRFSYDFIKTLNLFFLFEFKIKM